MTTTSLEKKTGLQTKTPKKKSNHRKLERVLFIAAFTLPTFILFCIFKLYALGRGLYISFFEWSGGSSFMEFVGLDNYKQLFQDDIIPRAIFNDYFLVFWKVIFIMLIATFLAVALTRFKLWESKFYRVIFFFPNLLSIVVIGVLWRFIYNPNLGFLNSFLSLFTDEPVKTAWIASPDWALWSLLPPSIWAGVGFYMILIMAGILNVPAELYEAAKMDGATEWKQFTSVTIPLVWEQMKVSILHIIITTLNGSFVIVWLMTEGGPDNATQVMGSYLYKMGFNQFHMGYAATIGVMMLVLSLITTLTMNRILKKETVEM